MSQLSMTRRSSRGACSGPLGGMEGLRAMLDSVEAKVFAADEGLTLILKKAKGVGPSCLRPRQWVLLEEFPSMWQRCPVRSLSGFG